MKIETVHGGKAESTLWLVERREFAELLNLVIPQKLTPSVKVRGFERPERALQALERCEEPPDLLMTAFHFDGDYGNGLWLVQEARKIHPNLKTVVTSGFPLEHLKGVAADWQAQPDLLLHKGEDMLRNWFPALKELLSQPGSVGRNSRPLHRVQIASDALATDRQTVGLRERRWRQVRGKPLVYLVGPSDSLRALKAYMDQVKPQRFQHGYDYQCFEHSELAWTSLSEARKKPDALVADYYLSGGYVNGLKLVRHAQAVVPRIWTFLVTWVSEHHIRGIMAGTGISPDLVFHSRNYRYF